MIFSQDTEKMDDFWVTHTVGKLEKTSNKAKSFTIYFHLHERESSLKTNNVLSDS